MSNSILEKGGRVGNYEWACIAHSLGFRCGYIRIPNGHPWCKMLGPELDIKVRCHGGITYQNGTYDKVHWESLNFSRGGLIVGFDCHHSGDKDDYDIMDEGTRELQLLLRLKHDDIAGIYNGVIWTADMVEGECRNIIKQAKAAEKNSRRRK